VERLRYFTIAGLARYPSLAFRSRACVVKACSSTAPPTWSSSPSAMRVVVRPGRLHDRAGTDQPRVAHHTHTPANVLKAIRLGVPALVLIACPRTS
jgi:hypothetical protein